MNEWIRVEDQMPVEGQRVVYYFGAVGAHLGYFGGYAQEPEIKGDEDGPHNAIFHGRGGFLTGDVTHWYPVPRENPK